MRTTEIDAALVHLWAEFLQTGECESLAQFIDKHPKIKKEECSHNYPWNHRLLDVIIGDQAYRVSRCISCGEQLTFTPIDANAANREPGVPTWLTGDALKQWAREEEERPAEDPVNWEVQRWRLSGEANISTLIQFLHSASVKDIIEVSKILGEIGPQAKEASPALLHLTQNTNQWVRLASAMASWRIAHTSTESLPVIISVLKSIEDTLKKIFVHEDNAFGELLRDHFFSSIKEILQFLGEMGSEAQPAVPELFRWLEVNSMDLRNAVLTALAQIQNDVNMKGG
jgi:hypothetical protein